MNPHFSKSLIVFADDWGRHPSSCQHLVRRLQSDHGILWVNTIGTRQPRLDSISFNRVTEKLRNWGKGLQQVAPRMWVLDLAMLPAMGDRLSRNVNRRLVTWQLTRALAKLNMHDAVVLTTLPYILWMIERISRRALIYYVTDDYSHWPDADRDVMVTADAEMTKTAQMVAAVSRPLLEKYASAARREYFPHGVDWEHFASSSQLTPPELIDKLPRPRIGFFGLIYEKLDFRLLSAVADHFRTGSLVMIGPEDYCEPQFASKPNVHRIGRQSYHELPTWISGLDALILPYVDDPMIRQSGPLKLRECLATGKPTVSVDVPEVRIFQPHVRMANSVDGFIRELEWALAEQSSELARARSESVRNDGWDLRAAQLRRWIQSLADAEPPYAVGERKMA